MMNVAEKWQQKQPDERLLKELIENRMINLIFAGRIRSEQDCHFLLEILRVFRLNYEEKIRLRIITNLVEGLAPHEGLLKKKINTYHLKDCIEFIEKPGDFRIMSYYLGSDMMLYTGGSGEMRAPITEAKFFCLPILVWGEERISDETEQDRLVLEERPELFAAAIHVLMKEREYAEYLSSQGKRNVYV